MFATSLTGGDCLYYSSIPLHTVGYHIEQLIYSHNRSLRSHLISRRKSVHSAILSIPSLLATILHSKYYYSVPYTRSALLPNMNLMSTSPLLCKKVLNISGVF